MKILITIIAPILLLTSPAKAQHIPDKNFAAAIREKCKECIDSNNNLLPPARDLDDLRANNRYINSIEGIQGFTQAK